MATIGDGFKNIFLAGIGAMAITGEKSKEIVDQLVAKGELTVDQGKQINTELKNKANKAATTTRDSALEARMMVMTPEEREAFAAKAAEIAAQQNANSAKAEAEEDVVEAEVIEDEQAPAAADAEEKPAE